MSLKPPIPAHCYAWHCLLSMPAEWSVCYYNTGKTRSPNVTALHEGCKTETVHLCFPPSLACSLRGKRQALGSVHSAISSNPDWSLDLVSGRGVLVEEMLGCLPSYSSGFWVLPVSVTQVNSTRRACSPQGEPLDPKLRTRPQRQAQLRASSQTFCLHRSGHMSYEL